MLLPAARMPEVAELPEQLKWFHSINAISLGAENIGETATRLADAIRNTATLEEPVAPVSLLTNSLRLGYRPMIVGPLWEALVITVSVASAIALAVAVPWIRTTRMRFGAFGIASLWAGNVLWGGFIGRRLGSWGAAAGAAIGAVLPWLPLGLASTTMIVAGIISSLFEDAADAYSVRATGAAMLGVPLAIGLTLLSAGRVAARGRSRRDESHWHPDSYQSLALGIAGLALGGSVGWIASSGPIGPPGWYELLAALLHTITVGILMGFMRGACESLENRRRWKPSVSSPPPVMESGTAHSNVNTSATVRVALKQSLAPRSTSRNVFLSYRRRDSADTTRRIYYALRA